MQPRLSSQESARLDPPLFSPATKAAATTTAKIVAPCLFRNQLSGLREIGRKEVSEPP